jgi:hypothetical protein
MAYYFELSAIQISTGCPILNFASFTKFRMGRTKQNLPGRLRDSGNLSTQRQPPETQPAKSKFAQKRPRTSANFAAVMPAR